MKSTARLRKWVLVGLAAAALVSLILGALPIGDRGKGLALNLLDARQLKAHDLQSFDPEEMTSYCRDLSPNVELVDNYLNNDFTIYMKL